MRRPGGSHHLSITAKLAAIVVVFVAIVFALVAVVTLSLRLASGARAYVGGEGLWSKGQKDAVYYLSRYAQSGQLADYQRYQDAMAIPLGDRIARLEMERSSYNEETVRRGFVAGGNAAQDVPDMIFLFRHFRWLDRLDAAIDVWRQAERRLLELEAIAAELHRTIPADQLAPPRQQLLLERIATINAAVAPLEREFSVRIGAIARWMQHGLPLVIVGFAALLLAAGLWVAFVISRDLRQAILALREGAVRVSQGDLNYRIDVRSGDELGELALVFNEMIVRRRLAEEGLRETTEFRNKVMQSATNAIFAFDLQGRFTLVNRQTCVITGYEEPELLGMSFLPLIPLEYRAEVQALFEAAASGRGAASNFETPIRRKDGSTTTIVFSNAPLMKGGTVIGVAGTAEDITERKRATAALAERAEELARSNTELEHFAYVASHDLQEPLRTVASFTQLLARRFSGEDPDANEFVGYITDEVQRMRQLIEGLLTYSRVTREKQQPEPTPLDKLLDAALANLRTAITETGTVIHRQALPTLPVQGPLITQLFQNLVGNAIKFRGEAPPRIDIDVQPDADSWQFSVRDNGIGIDPLYAERVFVLFQRLHTREVYPGSGIGLAICRKIVERHGGRIWVEPGYPGAIFRFTLPI
ncbi:PAS domain S-box protein [Solimonas sp. K1W22B-7]|uniref:sensor histidine kinase n=1 Tax=Solimonas sp. K1W22B-7 TaxID=2303331 RepID=UPI000E330422|nr:PAS domain S-box protein [Solimonas sp. K1W22B-7]AXQ28647.1 PAS domain S-box protein [Solimonas sp. K1W22B-7]